VRCEGPVIFQCGGFDLFSAKRMTPLSELRRHLLDLHQALVDAMRRDYERTSGRLSDGEFLEALVNDPAFAWLRPLTALIVRLDELLEEHPVPTGAGWTVWPTFGNY
jgi:hypothetical protein